MFFHVLVLILCALAGLSARAQTDFYGFLGPSVEAYGSLDPYVIEEWVPSGTKEVRACFTHLPFDRQIRFEVVRGKIDSDSVQMSVNYHNGTDELDCVKNVLEHARLGSASGFVTFYTAGRASRWNGEDLFYGSVGSPDFYIGGAREPQRFATQFEERDRELAYTCLASSRLDEARVVFQARVGKIERAVIFRGGRPVSRDDKDSAAATACLGRLVGREYPDQLTRTPVTLVYSFERDVVVSQSE